LFKDHPDLLAEFSQFLPADPAQQAQLTAGAAPALSANAPTSPEEQSRNISTRGSTRRPETRNLEVLALPNLSSPPPRTHFIACSLSLVFQDKAVVEKNAVKVPMEHLKNLNSLPE